MTEGDLGDSKKTVVERLIEKLRQYDDKGTTFLEDGASLIRKNDPREDGLFSAGYWHVVYSALNKESIAELQAQIQRELPPALIRFYEQANGISIFCGSMSIRGFRKTNARGGLWVPVSLRYGNVVEQPTKTEDGHEYSGDSAHQVRFGYFPAADAELVMEVAGQQKVYAIPRFRTGPVLHEWSGFSEMLFSLADHFINECDKARGKFDPMNPLPPPWASAQ